MIRGRTGTRSRSSTARTSTPSSSAYRRAWASTTHRATRAPSTAIWCWSSTTRITSTARISRAPGPGPADHAAYSAAALTAVGGRPEDLELTPLPIGEGDGELWVVDVTRLLAVGRVASRLSTREGGAVA